MINDSTIENTNLPAGWEMKSLGQVCEIYQPKTISKKEMDADGIYPVFGANGIIGRYNKYNHDKPQLLITCRGATCGSVNISEPKSWINGNAMVVKPTINNLLLSFTEYFFRGAINISDIITGAAQPQITRQNLSPVKIPFPPLPQQKQIVTILDKAFAFIDTAKANAEQNLQNAKELFESYLQNVFETKGAKWTEYELKEIVDERCSLSYGIVQPGNEFPNGLPVVRPTDMKNKFVNSLDLKLIDPNKAESYKRTSLVGDELLLCVRGDTGVISLITDTLYGANVTRGIVPICFDCDKLSLQFGYYLFASPFIQKQIKAKTYGAALMQINIRDVRKLLVRIPHKNEQEKIVKKLDALSAETKKLEAIYTQKIADLEEMKKSILQKAFSGQLSTIN